MATTIQLLSRMSRESRSDALLKASKKHNCHPKHLRQASLRSTGEAITEPLPFQIAYQHAAMQIGSGDPEDIVYSLPAYDTLIQDLELFQNSLLTQIPHLPGKGIGSLVQTRTASGKAWADDFVLDTASRSPQKGTYATNLSRFKNLYRSVDISIPLIHMTQDVTDVKRNEIDAQMEELKTSIIKGFFYGDETSQPTQWDGCVKLVDAGNLIQNSDDNGGGSFDYDKFKETWDSIEPNDPEFIIMTKEMRTKFSTYLEETFSQRLEYGNIKGGFRVMMFYDTPIIICKHITNTQTFNGTTTTNYESGGNCTSIFFGNWSNLRFKELLPLGLYQLGLNSALLSQYDIFGMRTLELRHKDSLAILEGINLTAETT